MDIKIQQVVVVLMQKEVVILQVVVALMQGEVLIFQVVVALTQKEAKIRQVEIVPMLADKKAVLLVQIHLRMVHTVMQEVGVRQYLDDITRKLQIVKKKKWGICLL